MTNHRTSSPPPAADNVAFERPLNGDPKGGIGQAYGWFLEQPIPIVITVLWLAGAEIIGLGGLAIYSIWSLL